MTRDDRRCAICNALASVRDVTLAREPRWLCRDHIAEEAAEVTDRIDELRRKSTPTRH
jgi:hypothetical protein